MDTTERLHFHFSLSCMGEGNGNPLQCSCLESPRDGGAWGAAVYGVAQSRTRLKRLSSSSRVGDYLGRFWECQERFISPSVVVVYWEGRDIPFYALIAGFTEIGETLEECVAREVMEEAGLRVKNIRYCKSQPWAIVDDLLAGFYCDVDGSTEIHMDAHELKEAVWMRREDVVGQPNDFSLTNEMMMTFKAGKEPK